MKSMIGWVCCCLCWLVFIGGGPAPARAESYIVHGSFSVDASTSYSAGLSNLVVGNASFSVPGFNPAWGTLISVEKNYSSNFQWAIKANSGVGIHFSGVISQGFLSPSYATSDPADVLGRIDNFIQTRSFWSTAQLEEQVTIQFPGQILPLTGILTPLPIIVQARSDANTLSDFRVNGSVRIQTWLWGGDAATFIEPLPATASGILSVKYNFTPAPGYNSPPSMKYDPTIQGGLGLQILIGSANQDELDVKKFLSGPGCADRDKYKEWGDNIETPFLGENDITVDDIQRPVKPKMNAIIGLRRLSAALFQQVYLIAGKVGLRVAEAIGASRCIDPPDPNFHEIAQRSSEEVETQLSATYGAQYAILDEAFLKFGIGFESWDLFMISLERMQGAILANDLAAANLQKARAIQLLTEGQTSLVEASAAFFDGAKVLSSTYPDLVPLTLRLSQVSSESTWSSALERARSTVTIPQLACTGPLSPFDKPLILKKKSTQTIPVKIVLKDATGYVVTDQNIAPAPVLSVRFNQTVTGLVPTNDANLLPNGAANTDNVFRYDPTSLQWIYNLGSSQFPASGKYTVQVGSGDPSKYTLSGNCTQTFERLP